MNNRNETGAAEGNQVERALESIADGDRDFGLYFDPTTGELRASRDDRGDDVDRLPATQMAREGFFAGGLEVLRNAPAASQPTNRSLARDVTPSAPAVPEFADEKHDFVLFFDPITGELQASGNEDDSAQDRLPATQMTREGFFAAGSASVFGDRDIPLDTFGVIIDGGLQDSDEEEEEEEEEGEAR